MSYVVDLLDWQDAGQRNHRRIVHRNQQNELRLVPEPNLEARQVHKKCFGNAVNLNDEQVALFRIGDEVHAIQAQCPHAGILIKHFFVYYKHFVLLFDFGT